MDRKTLLPLTLSIVILVLLTLHPIPYTKSPITYRGKVIVTVLTPDGELKYHYETENIVVTQGWDFAFQQLFSTSPDTNGAVSYTHLTLPTN